MIGLNNLEPYIAASLLLIFFVMYRYSNYVNLKHSREILSRHYNEKGLRLLAISKLNLKEKLVMGFHSLS